jgi:hypothetical protein
VGHKNRAHVVVHRNTKGINDKENVTNEEEERKQGIDRPTLKLAYNKTAR